MPLISDSIGRVLGKRYRLLSALGTGASAHVYLAEDVSLQRRAAVKVVQPGVASAPPPGFGPQGHQPRHLAVRQGGSRPVPDFRWARSAAGAAWTEPAG